MVLCMLDSILLVKRWTIWVQSNADNENISTFAHGELQ